MNRVWRQLAMTGNWPILAAIAMLASLGIVSIWADQPQEAKRQILFLAASFVVMLAMQLLSYQAIGRLAWFYYLAALGLVIYTIIPGAPRVPLINGARAWIDFGLLRLEPAEFLKLAFCILLARYLRFRSNYRYVTGLLPPFLLALVPVFFILRQPDLGMALLFFPALFAMLFAAGAKGKHLLAILLLGAALIPTAWFVGNPDIPFVRHFPSLLKNYQRERIKSLFSNDQRNLREVGFQVDRALTALGSGGVAGKGAMQVPVGGHIPEAHNDMIFALIGEQFGLFGAAVVLGAYAILFAAGLEIAAATREPFGRLIAVGVVAILAAQTFINLGVCLRLLPVTGITLPFVSYGGSSLLASFLAAGLLLNVGQNRPLVMARNSFEF